MSDENLGFAPTPAVEPSSLIVRNDYFGTVDVYVVTGVTRARIGSVMAAGTEKMRIPTALIGRTEIQLQLDPVGPEAPFTYRPIPLAPGHNIELSVAPMLNMSGYAIVLPRR